MIANSIREASSPLRVTGCFLGIFLFDYDKLYFNRLYMIAIWILYACAIVASHILLFERGQFTTAVGILSLNINWFIQLITVFLNATNKKTSDKCFEVLCIVDNTLKNLGVSVEYRTIYRDSLITLTLIFVVTTGSTTFSMITITYFNSVEYIIAVVIMYVYPYLLTRISDFNYWIVLRSIEDRFDRLNQYMENLSADRENHGRTISNNTCFILKSRRNHDSTNDQCNVWIIMKLHRYLNKTSRDINHIFSVDFGLQIGVYFFTTIELISTLYLIYIDPNKITMKKMMLIISHFIGLFLHSMKIVVINSACENIQRKSNAMEAVLTNYINTVHDPESWQEIHLFLMQVKQRPLQFTALGFINLGYKCLSSLLTSMTETVILMIQLGGLTHANYVHHKYNTTTND